MKLREIVLSLGVAALSVIGCSAPGQYTKDSLVGTSVQKYVGDKLVSFECKEGMPMGMSFPTIKVEDSYGKSTIIRRLSADGEITNVQKDGRVYVSHENDPETKAALKEGKVLWNIYCPRLNCEEIMRERCR